MVVMRLYLAESNYRELSWCRASNWALRLSALFAPRPCFRGLLPAGNWWRRDAWAELVLGDLALFWCTWTRELPASIAEPSLDFTAVEDVFTSFLSFHLHLGSDLNRVWWISWLSLASPHLLSLGISLNKNPSTLDPTLSIVSASEDAN